MRDVGSVYDVFVDFSENCFLLIISYVFIIIIAKLLKVAFVARRTLAFAGISAVEMSV